MEQNVFNVVFMHTSHSELSAHFDGGETVILLYTIYRRCPFQLLFSFALALLIFLPVELLKRPAFRKYVNNSPPTTYSNNMYKLSSVFVCQILSNFEFHATIGGNK